MAKRKVAVTRKTLVKNGERLIEVPIETVKSLLADAGFSGKALVGATASVFKEVKKLATRGVIDAADFEKAMIKGIKNTNDIAINTTTKIVRKMLK